MQQILAERLRRIHVRGLLRVLPRPIRAADFCSNDFLGLARDHRLWNQIGQLVKEKQLQNISATGSRLISGNSESILETERYIADRHQAPSALLLPSGYLANVALFSALPGRRDTVILDEYIHRSCIDGVTLSGARRWKFRHNDLDHLESLLKRNTGRSWIAVESLYSMDGDLAPLEDLLWLSETYQAGLFVDEAHAIGSFGLGVVTHLGLQNRVFATLLTYGKAMGQSGAAILGSDLLKQYLINCASPIVYSTAVSPFQSIAIQSAYEFLKRRPELRAELAENIACFRRLSPGLTAHEESPIQPVFIPGGNSAAEKLVSALTAHGLQTYFVRSPSVARGKERIRICLHQYNTSAQISLLAKLINQHL